MSKLISWLIAVTIETWDDNHDGEWVDSLENKSELR